MAVPVIYTGTESSYTGGQTSTSVDVPSVPDTGAQFLSFCVRSTTTVTPSGTGWLEQSITAADANPNKLRQWYRLGPQNAATITLTAGASIQFFGYGWGSNGQPRAGSLAANANQAAYLLTIDAPAVGATAADDLIVSTIIPVHYPRRWSVNGSPPAGSTKFHDRWNYATDGGLALAIASEPSGGSTASIGTWTPDDPDNPGAGNGGEYWRVASFGLYIPVLSLPKTVNGRNAIGIPPRNYQARRQQYA